MPNKQRINRFVRDVTTASGNAQNEAQLRQSIENALRTICVSEGAPWSPYTLERYIKGASGKQRYVDAVHGAVIIEYEPPKSFGGTRNHQYRHACEQAQEYAQMLAVTEGRPIRDYVLVVWDGETIDFGSTDGDQPRWSGPAKFDATKAVQLVRSIKTNGRPLVNPLVLAQHAGPVSDLGPELIPAFYRAIIRAKTARKTTKTSLLFTEWCRLFGQVVGIGEGPLRAYIAEQSRVHGIDYSKNTQAYLFALNTYIALLAKLVAACALPGAAQDIRDDNVRVWKRIKALEDGSLFQHAGLTNMVSGDFFSWYPDDSQWKRFEPRVRSLIAKVAELDFDITKKSPEATRDLFKGIYETCVPRELRHALGEFYTPDWLAEHGMDVLGWTTDSDLLDPTCGSGTFLLEALRRRLKKRAGSKPNVEKLLNGLWGTDLNPLAVLATKASLAVFLSPYLKRGLEIRLPVFLADAINPAVPVGNCYEHAMPTEKGIKIFRLPKKLVESTFYYRFMAEAQQLIDSDESAGDVSESLRERFPKAARNASEWTDIDTTVALIVELHKVGWNGIWCSILADRFAAGAIPKVKYICGNPPWVKWSQLPSEYASFIKPRCDAIGVFSQDTWVGGIEADISTVITYEAIDRYLADRGKLGFFITGTVFTNESSEGFRKFSLRKGAMRCRVLLVEDFKAIKPFDGVNNHPTFFVVEKGLTTRYPVSYTLWERPQVVGTKEFKDAVDFTGRCSRRRLVAKPVPGGEAEENRPWVIATRKDQKLFASLFKRCDHRFTARKGVTTDRNGIYWVNLVSKANNKKIEIENCNGIGRTPGIPKIQALVEKEHVFPLLRGQDTKPFKAIPSLHILVPQREMHGDPKLPVEYPYTYKYLRHFQSELKNRSSLRRFQRKQPWYSLWSTGPYTFAKHKVVWREMGGGDFFAAYAGALKDSHLGMTKVIIPDHKLYFIPLTSANAAHFLTGFLNAPCVRKAVNAYAAKLSLGTSIAEYLCLPKYKASNPTHKIITQLAKSLAKKQGTPTEADYLKLDRLVSRLL